jgi:hypothetical protein
MPTVEFPVITIPKYPLRYLSADEERLFLFHLNPTRAGSGLKPLEERDHEIRRNMQDPYDLVILLLDAGARHREIVSKHRAARTTRILKATESPPEFL